MFKEVERLCKEYTRVAKVLQEKTEKFHNMEDQEYAIQDELEEFKTELEIKYRKDMNPKMIADEQRCKCCKSVLTKAVVSPDELAKLEEKMFKKIDSHPKVKVLEERDKKTKDTWRALDKEIDTMSETIYEYEGEIKVALDALELPEAWFTFQTTLV